MKRDERGMEMALIGFIRFKEKYTASGTATKTFESSSPGRDRVAEITSGIVADYTTANKKLLIGIRDQAGNDHYVYVKKGSEHYQVHLEGPIYLLSDEKMIGVIESPTASDVLYCTFYGKVYAQKPVG